MATQTQNSAASAPASAGRVDDMAMPVSAMLFVMGTYLCFSMLDAAGKYLASTGLHVTFIVWVRFLVHGLLLFLVFKAWSQRDVWRMARPGLHLMRAALLPTTTLFNFAALQYLQLDQTMTVFLATPMVVTALAGFILGEWAGPRRWAAIFVGFIGVVVVARPGTSMFSPPILLSIGATLTYSLYILLTRKLANSETPQSLNFFPTLVGTLMLLPFAFTHWELPQTSLSAVVLFSTGVFGLAGHLLLIRASKITSASKLAPFIYTQLLWMIALGWIVFGDVPDFWTLFGAIIICSSGFYLMQREHHLRKMQRQDAHA